MKPFDLEKAKAGHPLVTRDGRVAKFVGYEPQAQPYSVVAYIERGDIKTFTPEGRYKLGLELDNDLFLADPPKVKKEVWIAVYMLHNVRHLISKDSKEDLVALINDEFYGRKLLGEIIHHTWGEESV